ncbi:hypothetical protein ACER0C_003463 [Sarotherodon galilaeus]
MQQFYHEYNPTIRTAQSVQVLSRRKDKLLLQAAQCTAQIRAQLPVLNSERHERIEYPGDGDEPVVLLLARLSTCELTHGLLGRVLFKHDGRIERTYAVYVHEVVRGRGCAHTFYVFSHQRSHVPERSSP